MWLYLGENVKRLEEEFSVRTGVEHAVGVSSGTDALMLGLAALELSSGDEVIVPSHTFIATIAPIVQLGGRPVFCDIDPLTYNLDVAHASSLITSRTVGVLPVHMYGQAADMDEVRNLATENGLWVLEDVAQAVGADYKGTPLGSIGDVGCFSFVYTKNIKAYGDAGMVTTNDGAIAERVRQLRDHGRVGKYEHALLGYNSRLGEIEAAITRIQLESMDARSAARNDNAHILTRAISGSTITAPYAAEDRSHVYHQYVVRHPQRDGLSEFLNDRGIGTGIHYPIPCHLQEACKGMTQGEGSLPNTELIVREILSVPVYPELTRDQLGRVTDAFGEFSGVG